MDNKGEDIILRKENPEENALLELKEFYREIDCREGFYQGGCSNLAWNDLIILQVQVNKENSMESPLDSIYYLYNYYMVCVLLSHTHHVISSCNVTLVIS